MRYFWPTWCHWCLYNKIIIIIIIPPGLLFRFLFCNISLCRLSRDKTKMRSLKDRYENFLEEEKRRLARNDKLLQTMEDIDYRASTLAAKTERLKLLKVSTLGIQYKRLTTPTRLPPPNRKLTQRLHPPEIRESTFCDLPMYFVFTGLCPVTPAIRDCFPDPRIVNREFSISDSHSPLEARTNDVNCTSYSRSNRSVRYHHPPTPSIPYHVHSQGTRISK